MRITLVVIVTLSLAGTVRAQTYQGCFERTYDDAHMAAHKGQTVASVKLKLKPRSMDDGFNVAAELRFAIRDGKDDYYAVGICKEEPDRLYCGLDQDAGQISLKTIDGGLMLTPISDVRADSSSGAEEDFVTIKTGNPEDRNFALRSAPAEACREFDDAE